MTGRAVVPSLILILLIGPLLMACPYGGTMAVRESRDVTWSKLQAAQICAGQSKKLVQKKIDSLVVAKKVQIKRMDGNEWMLHASLRWPNKHALRAILTVVFEVQLHELQTRHDILSLKAVIEYYVFEAEGRFHSEEEQAAKPLALETTLRRAHRDFVNCFDSIR